MFGTTAFAATASTEVGEVVVTGSRIANGYQAPTPVTVASTEQLSKGTPSSLSDALNTLPQFSNSTGLQKGATVQTQLGVSHGNSLNLRNLGPIRTLILMDGRRVPPSRYQGIVDVNQIPELLVQRVEVVTGGASAVYGSDAVAGVVNYILDNNFTGVKARAQFGTSNYADGQSYRVGAAFGQKFLDGRLHVLASAEHSASDPVFRDKRDPNGYVRDNWGFVADPTKPNPGTASNPLFLSPNVLRSDFSIAGHVSNGPPGMTDLLVSMDGKSVSPWNFGKSSALGAQIGGSGTVQTPHQEIIFGQNSDQLFGQAAYDVTPDLKATANASWTRSSIHGKAGSSTINGLPIFSGNVFLPADLQAALTAANKPSVTLTRLQTEVAPTDLQELNKSWQGTFGLSGKLSDDWNFDAYYSHGAADSTFTYQSNLILQHIYAAIDAVRDPATGATVCRVALTNPGLYPGCVPYNPFGYNNASQAAKDYVFGTSVYGVKVRTDDVSAYVNGELFSTWAGPIGVSVGGTYRTASLDVTSNSNPAAPLSTTGIRGAPATVTPFFQVNQGVTHGSNNVKELSGELNVPLAKDWMLAKSLDLSLAGRWTDYSTSGAVKTWKVGLSYRPFDDLRIRGTISRDIRAPSLFELFAGGAVQTATVVDPHTSQTKPSALASGGNPNLTPERGDTKSIGVIYQPSWLHGFSASIDYYDIRIRDAIGSPTANSILLDCDQSGGTSSACGLITRPLPFSDHSAANFVTAVQQVPLNTAFLANRGVDVDASYNIGMEQLAESLRGSVTLRALVNYVSRYATQTDRASPVRELAGTTDGMQPKVQGLFSADYRIDGLNLHGQVRYIGKLKAGPSRVYLPGEDTLPAIKYLDLTASYTTEKWGQSTEFFVTVNNVFNKGWPLFPLTTVGSNAPTLYTVYDLMGRYFTVGAKARF